MDKNYLMSAMEAILFASGEPVPAARIAQVLGAAEDEVYTAAETLERGSGIRLLRLDKKLQLCSAPEHSQTVTHALEQRKPPKLSPSALEVLAITAYFQPVTRAYIDQIRGVDSSYTVGVLIDRGLIEACGKLDVPGRPILYRTTEDFLRCFIQAIRFDFCLDGHYRRRVFGNDSRFIKARSSKHLIHLLQQSIPVCRNRFG